MDPFYEICIVCCAYCNNFYLFTGSNIIVISISFRFRYSLAQFFNISMYRKKECCYFTKFCPFFCWLVQISIV